MAVPSTGPILRDVHRTESYYFACGGLADLYKGQWTRQPNDILQVAIKLIRRCTWNDNLAVECALKRFLREARLWEQLRHPNIVPFYGLIYEQDFPGLVMPYYKNGDLGQYLRKHPDVNKLDLICQVSAGLVYLHNLKPNPVVHGDIKASNIMVTDYGQACLADFGLARMLSVSGYTTSSARGTCRWMSPELQDAENPSPTMDSDVWAFSMTVLQTFTGRVPFSHIRNNTKVTIELERGHLPEQPPEIDDIMWALMKRCWASEPSQRPAVTTLYLTLNDIASKRVQSSECVHRLVDNLEAHRRRHSDTPEPACPAFHVPEGDALAKQLATL